MKVEYQDLDGTDFEILRQALAEGTQAQLLAVARDAASAALEGRDHPLAAVVMLVTAAGALAPKLVADECRLKRASVKGTFVMTLPALIRSLGEIFHESMKNSALQIITEEDAASS